MKTLLATILLFQTAFCQKTLRSEESLEGVKSIKVVVNVGTIYFVLKRIDDPGKAFSLYCTYPEEGKMPNLEYEVEGEKGVLHFSNEKQGSHFPWFRINGGKDTARLLLANSVPISLSMNFGVSDANIDLGGMRLSDATFSTGVCDFNRFFLAE